MSDLTAAVEAATPAVLAEMDWPDDREFSAHVEPDGYQLTPPGAYWDAATEVARAAIAAAAPLIEAAARADERTKVVAEAMAAVERIYGPGADDTYFVIADQLRAIARQYAGNGPQNAPDAISAPPESDRTPEGAQTLSGRNPGGPVLPARPRLYDPAVDGPIEFPKSST